MIHPYNEILQTDVDLYLMIWKYIQDILTEKQNWMYSFIKKVL